MNSYEKMLHLYVCFLPVQGRRVQFTVPVVMGKQEAPVSAFEGEETKETKRGRYGNYNKMVHVHVYTISIMIKTVIPD